MRHVGFILEDGFQVMGLAALSAFEFANIELGREGYRVTVMSEAGGPVRTSLGMMVETARFEDAPDTLMVLGRIVPQPPSPALRAPGRRPGSGTGPRKSDAASRLLPSQQR